MGKKTQQYDLFGEPVIENVLLRDKFIEPPFSVLDTKTGSWQNRKRQWKLLGMRSEVGRGKNLTQHIPMGKWKQENMKEEFYDEVAKVGTSTFDPALTELMYYWFCPKNGKILDPFAGGSVRGIIANYLGYKYTGIELRLEQIESNIEQAEEILPDNNRPKWYMGDSEKILDDITEEFDFIFSCPPYMDLEKYSDLPEDLSNMSDKNFIAKYLSIIKKACSKLKSGGFACFVVGDVRDKKTGYYKNFVTITNIVFNKAGMKLYNEAILLNPVASASMRASKQFTAGKKLVKIHQNVLIFIKP